MEEKEIIKTDDPNIVIERTIIDKQINVAEIREQITGLENEVSLLNAKKIELEKIKAPAPLVSFIENELTKTIGEIYSCEQEIGRLNNLIV